MLASPDPLRATLWMGASASFLSAVAADKLADTAARRVTMDGRRMISFELCLKWSWLWWMHVDEEAEPAEAFQTLFKSSEGWSCAWTFCSRFLCTHSTSVGIVNFGLQQHDGNDIVELVCPLLR